MQKHALLIVNGENPSQTLVKRLAGKASITVCTDGAANNLQAIGINPDVIIGDLDSISPETLKACSISSQVIHKPSQYSTDFEKAMDYILEQAYDRVCIIGLNGGRFDHAFTNLSILLSYAARIYIEIHDTQGYGVMLSTKYSEHNFELPAGSIVSLLPLDNVTGITTSGLLYPLSNEELTFGGRNGQSNQVIGGACSVKIESGTLLLYAVQS